MLNPLHICASWCLCSIRNWCAYTHWWQPYGRAMGFSSSWFAAGFSLLEVSGRSQRGRAAPFNPPSELHLVVHCWSQVAWNLAEEDFQGVGHSLRVRAEAVATEEPTGIANGEELKPKKSKPTESLEDSETCLWGLSYWTYVWNLKKERSISRDMNQTSWATLETSTLLQSQNIFVLAYPKFIKAKYFKIAEKQNLIQIDIWMKTLTKSIIYMPSVPLGAD